MDCTTEADSPIDAAAALAFLDAWGDQWAIEVDRLLDQLAAEVDGDLLLPEVGEMGSMSVSAYAKYRRERGLRGGSRKGVQDALTVGKIHKLPDGTIDPAVADIEWDGGTDQRKLGGPRPRSGPGAASSSTNPDAEAFSNASSQSAPVATLNQARLVNEVLRAKRQRLHLGEEEKRLVDAEAVARKWFEVARRTRDLLVGMIDQLAPEQYAAARAEADEGRGVAAVRALYLAHLQRALTPLDVQPSVGGQTK